MPSLKRKRIPISAATACGCLVTSPSVAPWAKAAPTSARTRPVCSLPASRRSAHHAPSASVPDRSEAQNRILFIFEGGAHVWRQVWMDGRAHPKDPNPDWLGHSIGHWEGNTLVVDSVGFNDKTWLDDFGHPHTERLHVIEKYTRTIAATMKYDVVIDDPGADMQSWTISSSFSFQPKSRNWPRTSAWTRFPGNRPPETRPGSRLFREPARMVRNSRPAPHPAWDNLGSAF